MKDITYRSSKILNVAIQLTNTIRKKLDIITVYAPDMSKEEEDVEAFYEAYSTTRLEHKNKIAEQKCL